MPLLRRESRLAQTINTFDDLKRLLSNYTDDREGNTALAMHVWGYRYWNRIVLLRSLMDYFESVGVTTQDTLRRWANTATFRHFQGKVPGMGYAIYQWLIMRQGVETIKPDIHVRRFVTSTIGHDQFTDEELVHALESIANRLGVRAYELDWRIWEYQRSVNEK